MSLASSRLSTTSRPTNLSNVVWRVRLMLLVPPPERGAVAVEQFDLVGFECDAVGGEGFGERGEGVGRLGADRW